MNHEHSHHNHHNHHDRHHHGAPRRGPGGPGFGPDFASGFGPGYGRGAGRGFGPRGPRRAGRGDVRAAILSLLADGPSNGYGLIKAIAEKTNGAWRPSPGSVYPTLQQLVDEELILSTGDGRKTEYELTESGREHVDEHAEQLQQAWEASPGRTESDAALHESVGKLMGVMGQFRGASEEQRRAAAEKLDEARRALYLILAD